MTTPTNNKRNKYMNITATLDEKHILMFKNLKAKMGVSQNSKAIRKMLETLSLTEVEASYSSDGVVNGDELAVILINNDELTLRDTDGHFATITNLPTSVLKTFLDIDRKIKGDKQSE